MQRRCLVLLRQVNVTFMKLEKFILICFKVLMQTVIGSKALNLCVFDSLPKYLVYINLFHFNKHGATSKNSLCLIYTGTYFALLFQKFLTKSSLLLQINVLVVSSD